MSSKNSLKAHLTYLSARCISSESVPFISSWCTSLTLLLHKYPSLVNDSDLVLLITWL